MTRFHKAQGKKIENNPKMLHLSPIKEPTPILHELQQWSSDYISIMTKFLTPILERNLKAKVNTNEGYFPKQSKRVKLKSSTPADGDTWTEHIVVLPEHLRVDKSKKKVIKSSRKKKTKRRYRSYFKSNLTKRSVWDEPPSGATKIILFHERRLRVEI